MNEKETNVDQQRAVFIIIGLVVLLITMFLYKRFF